MLFFPLWKRILVIGICLVGLLFAMPNLFYDTADSAARAQTEIAKLEKKGEPVPAELRELAGSWPSYLPIDVVNLGLDLRGGAHLLVEVQIAEVVAERMQSLRGDARKALIEGNVRRFTNLRATADQVTVRITKAEDFERAGELLRGLAQSLGGFLGGGFGMGGGVVGGVDLEIIEAGDQSWRIVLTEPAIVALTDRTMQQSLEVIRRRIDAAGTREPSIQRQGTDRVLIQVPGIGSAEELLGLIGRTAKLTFHRVEGSSATEPVPGPGQIVVPDIDDGTFYLLERRAILTGEHLIDSSMGSHPQNGLPIVNFRFDTAGARIFGNYTSANIGQRFATVLDGVVITAPVIQSAILGGSGFIEGNFTSESARDLSILLRSGALPASISVLEQRTVGPDLGADSIEQGQSATLIAFAAVLVFMAVYYGMFGLFANIALLLNVGLIFGMLSLIGATLTLPGIAGIVLTIGMAVDANVLIFERIKEELRSAKSVPRAIERGYEQAYSAIFDANITTLIAAVILFAMGSGPVKGFAVTLGFGIVTSVFTAVMVVRMMIGVWVRLRQPKTLKVNLITLLPEKTRIGFMGFRKICARLSGGAVLASLLLVAVLGLNFGIDFRGGTLVEVRTAAPADLGQIRRLVSGMELGDVQVQSFGSEIDVLVRIEEQTGEADQQMAVAAEVGEVLKAAIPGTEIRRVESVGPKVSGELLQAGVLAILLAVGAVLFYIWLRFEWQFGVGAVVALGHDVALTVGVFALIGIEFNLTTIAAILTIVGYSLNDTVVVYDRVRENLRKYKKMTLSDLLDLSLNETLSRTLMTSATTLIALGALFALGPEVIKGFTFAMIWGIVIGTYSSVFVAAPLLLWFRIKRDWSTADEQKAGVQFGGAQV
ncbi:MAG: protein translocase subunit SecD [Proteobacteria bacterium]|nr:protein translocase subunit SecD [Pseudomonadota bacterium]